MINQNVKARTAGLIYLMVVLTGIFSLMYVPNQLINWNDAASTFHNISTEQTLFRYGILGHVICYTSFFMLPLALYRLLHKVHHKVACIMILLVFVSVPISFMNLTHKLTVLNIINDTQYQANFTIAELQSQVMFYLNQYDNGVLLVSLFWGLWLLPFGYLVFKSKFLPKVLGVLLMLGFFGYTVNFIGHIIIEDYNILGIAKYISMPASIAEIGTCLWLLVFGAKSDHLSTPTLH
jgi:hypothetical protein